MNESLEYMKNLLLPGEVICEAVPTKHHEPPRKNEKRDFKGYEKQNGKIKPPILKFTPIFATRNFSNEGPFVILWDLKYSLMPGEKFFFEGNLKRSSLHCSSNGLGINIEEGKETELLNNENECFKKPSLIKKRSNEKKSTMYTPKEKSFGDTNLCSKTRRNYITRGSKSSGQLLWYLVPVPD